jgi:putative FmdB family regulatory protein
MPKYEYACKSCGQRLEVVQSFSDAPLTECEACGGALRKVYSAPAIAFKGSGFYRTDNVYRRTDAKADGKADAGSSTVDGKAEAAKTESAPAAAESKPQAAEATTA